MLLIPDIFIVIMKNTIMIGIANTSWNRMM